MRGGTDGRSGDDPKEAVARLLGKSVRDPCGTGRVAGAALAPVDMTLGAVRGVGVAVTEPIIAGSYPVITAGAVDIVPPLPLALAPELELELVLVLAPDINPTSAKLP